MKRLLFSITLFSVISSFAQVEKKYSVNNATPNWVQVMYTENANFGEVVQLYEAYYTEYPFIKNKHTQYFKRWVRDIQHQTAPNSNENSNYWQQNEANFIEKTNELRAQRGGNGWVSLGPFDFDKEAEDRSYAAGAAHIYTVEQSVSNPTILYAGTANAGVWKSTDKGENWTPLTNDRILKTIYSVEIDFTNPDIVYFGGSDGDLYKTTDGGSNWNVIGDATFNTNYHEIRDIVLDPTNPQIIFIASDQGLYKSTDGGNNFNENITGEVQEIEFHPTNHNIVYAVKLVGSKTQFHKSTDNGNTFTQISGGWPTVSFGEEQKRTEIAVSAAAPNKVFALATGDVNGGEGLVGVYVSADMGESWDFTCCGASPGGAAATDNINLMGWDDAGLDDGGQYYYDLAFDVSPTDADSLFVGGVNLWVSGDGGETFTCPAKWSHSYKDNYVHADIHDIRFFGSDLWVANDGGIFHSTNSGETFDRKQNGIEGTDFWGFGVGFWDGEVMVGGTYHNGTLLKDNDVFNNGWISTDGGDNTRGFVNPGDNRIVYTDYNRKKLSGDRTIAAQTFPYGNKPNANGAGRESEIVFDYDCYTCFYTGFENKLWYTTDNGSSYELINEFEFNVGEIEISRANADVLYVTTYEDYWGEKAIWKSIDKGMNWEEITIPTNMLNGNESRPYVLAVSSSNANELFVGRVGYFEPLDGYKIYKTTDGGEVWENITTPALDGELIVNIVHQQGTDGGLWVGTRRSVYYVSNTLFTWQLFNSNLPASTYSRRLVPYYRKSKIRNGTDRSVYEANFIEPSNVLAQISVNSKNIACTQDTAYFVDNSILNENGATWSWTFEGGTPATSMSRTPKVVFNQPGTYDVSLTVTNSSGTDSQTLTDFITINNGCAADTIPGNSALFSDDGDYLTTPSFGITSNELSISAWIKPSSILDAYSGIVIGGNNTTGGLNLRENMELAYHWPGGEWYWESGLFVPVDEWSHVAMVVTPSNVTLYLNGEKSVHTINTDPCDFTNATYIGSYKGWDGRNFKGSIDEVCIWNSALSQNEIREQLHLTKRPNLDINLLAYYQFNNDVGQATDRANGMHASFAGNAIRNISSAPVGGGVSDRLTISNSGLFNGPNTNTDIEFGNGAVLPDGEIVVSRLNILPNVLPQVQHSSGAYWIINNYGTNQNFNSPALIRFDGIKYLSSIDAATPDSFELYQRPWNAEINNWDSISIANSAIAGEPGILQFESLDLLTSFGQYFILNQGLTLDTAANNDTVIVIDNIISIQDIQGIAVYPNPAQKGSTLNVVSQIDDELTFELYDLNGILLESKKFFKQTTFELTDLPSTVYYYKIMVDKYFTHGKVIIR